MLKYRRTLVTCAVILCSFLIHQFPIMKQLLQILELRTYDLILDIDNALRQSNYKPQIEDIVIIDIDEDSISELGQFSTWPSLFFADLIDSLAQNSPALIAFDIYFTEPDSLNEFGQTRMREHLLAKGFEPGKLFDFYTSDGILERAIKDAGNVYLAMFDAPEQSKESILPEKLKGWEVPGVSSAHKLESPKPPIERFSNAAKGLGFAHVNVDISRVVHSYHLFFTTGDKLYVNFAFQACLDSLKIDHIEKKKHSLRLYKEGELVRKMPLSQDGSFFLKYYGPSKRFRYISFLDVLKGELYGPFFKDKTVLIGSSAAGLRDAKPSPLDQHHPGVELHATFMQNVLQKDFVHWLPLWLSWLIAASLLVSVAFIIRRLKPLQSLILFLIVSALLFISFQALYMLASVALHYSIYLFTWLLGFIGILANESQLQYAERKKLRGYFEHYVSKNVISEIMRADKPIKVGGEKAQVSIIFTDIRGFSALCEQLPVEEISDLLHNYFNRCTKEIMERNGTLDKYIGDAVLGLFNVPLPIKDYQLNACKSGLGIVIQSQTIRAEYADHPVLNSFALGVGIASGEIIAGNFGSDEIFNYTGIGDKMNLASRLEALTRFYNTNIIIDKATFEAVQNEFLCRYLDRICVKGKDQVVDIYELICPISEAKAEDIGFIQAYEAALSPMVNGDLTAGQAAFAALIKEYPADFTTKLMYQRAFEQDAESWDGIWRHGQK